MADAVSFYDWCERYRPDSEELLEGNISARQSIRTWLDRWESGKPQKKGLLLIGPPGVGKTTIARAIAADKGWNVIELNASDDRNAAAIRKAATRGATHRSLFHSEKSEDDVPKQRTIILLDEVDHIGGSFTAINEARVHDNMIAESTEDINLAGDSGGKGELLNLLQKTSQPVILACNDEMRFWGRGRNWKTSRDKVSRLALKVDFRRADEEAKRRISRRVLQAEEISIDPGALDYFVRQNPGDLRALVKDLQMLAQAGSGHINLSLVREYSELTSRDNSLGTFPGLERLYRANTSKDAVAIVRLLDKDPDDMAVWVSWNNSSVYSDSATVSRGARALSICDQALHVRFTNRAYRSWYWGSCLSSLAASVIADVDAGRLAISFPGNLLRGREPWRRGGIIEKLADSCGCSRKAARQELYPPLAAVHSPNVESNDTSDFTLSLAYGLDGEEHITLCALKPSSKSSKELVGRYSQAQNNILNAGLSSDIDAATTRLNETTAEQVAEEQDDDEEDTSPGDQQTLF